MVDIAMCMNKECPNFDSCYRAQARADEYRQSYGLFSVDKDDKCKYYWPIKIEEDNTNVGM